MNSLKKLLASGVGRHEAPSSAQMLAAWLLTLFVVVAVPTTAWAQQTLAERAEVSKRPHLSFYGTPGLIDMPSAFMMPDADLALTFSRFGGNNRGTLAFQVFPRVIGVFRYSRIADFNPGDEARFDRSFDIAVQLWDEGTYRPAVTAGLRDFGGTALFGGEYLVASKTLPRGFTITAGLGWGRLASEGGFTNPLGIIASQFETRPGRSSFVEDSGQFNLDTLFRGDAAAFGGVTWQPTDRLTLVAEYSSDAYVQEVERGTIEISSNVNYGLSYRFSQGFDLGLYYLYGTEVGVRLSYVFNPKVPPQQSGIEPGPQPVMVRPSRDTAPEQWSTAWVASDAAQSTLETAIVAVLAPEGLTLEQLTLSANEARVAIRNNRFDRSAQAVGRAARALTRVLPASVEVFRIVMIQQGIPTTEVRLNRSDLEELEFAPDNVWQSYVRSTITDAGDQQKAPRSVAASTFTFSLTPYVAQSFFDPDQPLSFDLGVEGTARYEPRPGFVLDASVRQPIFSNRSEENRLSTSVLPFVRSEQDEFNRGDGPQLSRLTFTHFGRPAKNVYSRFSAGFLELAYAGVSGEVLWKPSASRLALGLEVSAVHQREPGEPFELGTGDFDNDAITGHASLYYAFDNGFQAQVDAGRYLAEDWGGTFTLAREFRNGWRVGAFFTLTDVSTEDFGEGAFDKGIFLTIPISWGIGQPTQDARTTIIRPVLRDGGAKLRTPDKLYDLVREDSDPFLSDSWGRFWR